MQRTGEREVQERGWLQPRAVARPWGLLLFCLEEKWESCCRPCPPAPRAVRGRELLRAAPRPLLGFPWGEMEGPKVQRPNRETPEE